MVARVNVARPRARRGSLSISNTPGVRKGIPFDPTEIDFALQEAILDDIRQIGSRLILKLVNNTPRGMPSLWKNPPPADYRPGHAKKNWLVNFGRAIGLEIPGLDPGGGATISAGLAKMATFNNLNIKVIFENNVPYISRLDAGHSSQAPTGITDKSIQSANMEVFRRSEL